MSVAIFFDGGHGCACVSRLAACPRPWRRLCGALKYDCRKTRKPLRRVLASNDAPGGQQCPWMKKPVSQTGSPQEGTVRTGSDPAARSARHSGQPGRFGQVPAALESALEKRSGASFIAVDHVANAASSRIRAVTQARSSRKLPGPRTGPGASKAPRKRSLLHGSRLSPCRGGENRRGAQRASRTGRR